MRIGAEKFNISKFPGPLKVGIRTMLGGNNVRIIAAEYVGHRVEMMNDIGEMKFITPAKIETNSALWMIADVAPCLFVAILRKERNSSGPQGMVLKHFGAGIHPDDFLGFLTNLGGAEGIKVNLAGFSQRSSRAALHHDAGVIVDCLNKFGLPHQAVMDFEQPIIFERDTARVISDIGLDIGGNSRLLRRVIVGAAQDGYVFISIVHTSYGQVSSIRLGTDEDSLKPISPEAEIIE